MERYYPTKSEPIDVISQSSTHFTNFLFGVPAPENPNYGDKVAFVELTFRDTMRTKRFYLNATELKHAMRGIAKLYYETGKKETNRAPENSVRQD